MTKNKPFRIMAHRRSGNHFLWQSMSRNFSVKEVEGFKYHRPYKFANKKIMNRYNCIYLVRDVRDTLVATWHYWSNLSAEPSMGVNAVIKGVTVSEFIHGISEKKLKKFGFKKKTMLQRIIYEHLNDPVQHWVDYSEWSDYLYVVRFEDLKLEPKETLKKISENFGLKFKKNKINPLNKLVGNFPRKGLVGEWKSVLSDDDNEYVISKAKGELLKFNYEV